MNKFYAHLPLILLLGGYAAMEAMSLSTPAGDPTPAWSGLNELARGLTGIDVVKIWGASKGAEMLFTKRGRDNAVNAFNPKTGLKGTVQSLSSIFLGVHSPESAKGAAPGSAHSGSV